MKKLKRMSFKKGIGSKISNSNFATLGCETLILSQM